MGLAFVFNASLRKLSLPCCKLTSTNLELLGQCLALNSTLTALDLSANQLTSDLIEIFIQAVVPNSTLQRLDLSWNRITRVNFLNSTLTHLDLSYNYIDAIGFEELGRNLTVNSTLTTLNVGVDNKLTADQLGYPLRALEFNSTLQILEIENSHDVHLADLVQAIRTNSTLTSLTVCMDNYTGDNLDTLEQALMHNASLVELTLGYDFYERGYMERLDPYLERNQDNQIKTEDLLYKLSHTLDLSE